MILLTTLQGLLSLLSRIEKHVDQSEELGVLLQKGESGYELIDENFLPINRKRWITLTDSDALTARTIFVRLVQVARDELLNVRYSQRKFRTERGLAWELVSLQIMHEKVKKDLSDARRRYAPARELKAIESSLSALQRRCRETRRRRIAQKFALLAVRYHLIDPGGLLFNESEAYLAAVHSQAAFRKPDNTNSGSLRVNRHDPQALSRQRSRSQILGLESLSKEKVTKKSRLPMLTATDTEIRDRQIAQRVIDHFKAPGRPGIVKDTNDTSLSEEQALQSYPRTADQVQSRFRALRRSVTIQSLVQVPEKAPRLLRRARTLNPSFDIEAQTQAAKKSRGTAQTPDPRGISMIPILTANGSKGSNEPKGLGSDHRTAQSPYIFRTHTSGLGGATAADSPGIAPPPLPSLANEKEHSSRCVEAKQPQSKRPTTPVDSPRANEIAPSNSGADKASNGRASVKAISLLTKSTASSLDSNRKLKDIKQLQPFFQWTGPGAAETSRARVSRDGTLPIDTEVMGGSHISGERLAEDTLEIFNLEMQEAYLISDDFPIRPEHYGEVHEKTIGEVVRAFDDLFLKIQLQSRSSHPAELQKLSVTKLSIFLKVDTILSCFVGHTELDSVLIRKAWGVVVYICQLSQEEVTHNYPPRYALCTNLVSDQNIISCISALQSQTTRLGRSRIGED